MSYAVIIVMMHR